MEWKETSIGWFISEVGPCSIVLEYYKGKGYRISIFGFFHETRYYKYITDLKKAKDAGLDLLVHVLKNTLEKAESLKREREYA